MTNAKDRRILKEDALLVMPTLAEIIGLREAIILQQIHYFIIIATEKGDNYKDGYYWTYNSAVKWQKQFPFWHVNTIRNALKNLENKSVLITGCYNKMRGDRSKWYRINYEKLNEILKPFNKTCEKGLTRNVKSDLTNIVQPVPNTSTNTSTDTTKDIDHFFETVWEIYPHKIGKGKIKQATKRKLFQLGFETLEKCINRYKDSKPDWQEWQHGSTFFNSGYVDYLDENFNKEEITDDSYQATRKDESYYREGGEGFFEN